MKILFIHRQKDPAKPSIYRGFEPLRDFYSNNKANEVSEIFLPHGAGSITGILKNILYVRKHRLKDGVNHVTGETHYAIIGLIGVPSVLTIHDDYALSAVKYKWYSRFLKWLLFMYLPIKLADIVICITPATKSKIDKYVKNKKTRVLTHQDLTSAFPYSPKEFNFSCPTIFHMGTAPNKNLETSIKAVASIKCKLRVLKRMSQEQIELAEKLKVDYINRYNLSNEEVFNEYYQSDIILFPSLYEGLGMPILEGQSIGRPVITTDKEPMNWVAGENGALLIQNPLDVEEIRNAIQSLCDNKKMREELILNGRNNVKRFSIPNIAKAYMDIYKSAIANHRKSFFLWKRVKTSV